MFENEDMILPEGFEDASTDTPDLEVESTPEGNEQIESEEPTADGEATLTEEQQEAERLLRLKYNSEDKDLPESEVIKLAQIGMNYQEKIQGQFEQLKNDPGRIFLQDLAKENGFDNVNDFINDFKAMQEQARIDELVQQNVPEQYAREMIENQKFRDQFQQQQQQREQEQREQQEYVGLIETFREFNDRDFNPDTDKIPDEVFQKAQEDNIPLKYAYADFMSRQFKQQQSIYKQNEQNLKRSTGGNVTQHGSVVEKSTDDFLDGFDSY